MRLRQREARRGGENQSVTTFSSLPAELIGSVIEYACPDRFAPEIGGQQRPQFGSWLAYLTCVGCVNKSCLEALKYVGTLQVDIMPWASRAAPSRRHMIDTPAGRVAASTYDINVQRWCDVARRRLRHVRKIRSGGNCEYFNPRQTELLVDCFASFSSLESLRFLDCDLVAACVRMSANVREGRFRRLKRLDVFWCYSSWPQQLGRTQTPEHVNLRYQAKICLQDLISQLPPDLGMDLMLKGPYPRLVGRDGDWDTWASKLFDLISRGADIRSRHMICEVAELIEMADYDISQFQQISETFYNIIERLLAVPGVDPNSCEICQPYYAHDTPFSRPVLWRIIDQIAGGRMNIEPDPEDITSGPRYDDPAVMEPVFRCSMRVLDLLLQHGAHCSCADMRDRDPGDDDVEMRSWILARPDCTPRVRDAVNRGELFYG